KFKAEVLSNEKESNDLQNLFLACVRDVKKNVARRKLKARLRTSKGYEASEDAYYKQLYRNKSKRDILLTDVDKRVIMERFLMNDKVFGLLHSTVFVSQ